MPKVSKEVHKTGDRASPGALQGDEGGKRKRGRPRKAKGKPAAETEAEPEHELGTVDRDGDGPDPGFRTRGARRYLDTILAAARGEAVDSEGLGETGDAPAGEGSGLPPGEELMAVAEMAKAAIGVVGIAAYGVVLDPEQEERILTFSPASRAVLARCAPAAEPVIFKLIQYGPGIAAAAFAVGWTIDAARTTAELKAIAKAQGKGATAKPAPTGAAPAAEPEIQVP